MADSQEPKKEVKEPVILNLNKTAIVNIEFQNDFCKEGGKLFNGVKGVIESTKMLQKAPELNKVARDNGCTVIHAPIIFEVNSPHNSNPTYGILAGCASNNLFQKGTDGAEFYEPMKPQEGDLVVQRKKGEFLIKNWVITVS